ncbi:MAG: sodium-dependent bicarbonate transport family permease [Dethiobacter sp.]|nr:sodium-dependent bicarbonate transport family permease [Dethiobacter sp.]
MMADLVIQNIFSPFALFFLLGLLAAVLKSDLKFPDAAGATMGIFLLAAIGLRAGVDVSKVGLDGTILTSAVAATAVGALLAAISFYCLRSKLIGLDPSNAGSVAGHFAAVSSATLVMTVVFLEQQQVLYDAFVPGLYPFMDTAALVVAIILARIGLNSGENAGNDYSIRDILREALTARTTILLLGGLTIGFIAGESGTQKVMPLFDSLFHGVTTLFMLEMGVLAGSRLSELKGMSKLIIGYGLVMPFINMFIGAVVAALLGLGPGGITIFAIGLAGSCSYISAPIVMRTALPNANPSLSLGLSLLVAFPLNITLRIPLAYQLALSLDKLF